MMRRISLHAYDCLESIHVTLRLSRDDDAAADEDTFQNAWVADAPSVGREDDISWIRDALTALLERL